MKQKVCKKCKKVLPFNYKYSRCEACRNKFAQNARNAGKVAVTVISVAATIVVGGKIKIKK